MDTVIATGESGKRYEFELFEKGTHFKSLSGVYIFLRHENQNRFDPVYIGEADSFRDRIDENFELHHQYNCISKNKYTHIAVLIVQGDRQRRLDIETDLRQGNPSFCNKQ